MAGCVRSDFLNEVEEGVAGLTSFLCAERREFTPCRHHKPSDAAPGA